jgi:hypothetical protein
MSVKLVNVTVAKAVTKAAFASMAPICLIYSCSALQQATTGVTPTEQDDNRRRG